MNPYEEIMKYLDQGQTESGPRVRSAEDIFVSFMQHPDFQAYSGLGGLDKTQMRALYGISELARRRAREFEAEASQAGETNSLSGERVHRLRRALRSARRQMRHLARSLREREARLAVLESSVFTPPAPSSEKPRAPRPSVRYGVGTAPRKPSPSAPPVVKPSKAEEEHSAKRV